MTDQTQFVSVRTATEISSLSEPTIRRWLASGKLTRHRPHGTRRSLIALDELRRVLCGQPAEARVTRDHL